MRSTTANFVFGLLLLSAPAFAEPLTLEVTEAEVAYDTRNGQPVVTFRMSDAAARRSRISARNMSAKKSTSGSTATA